MTTELYLNHDPYLDSDAVFGVRASLVIDLAKEGDGYSARYDFVMEPLPTP